MTDPSQPPDAHRESEADEPTLEQQAPPPRSSQLPTTHPDGASDVQLAEDTVAAPSFRPPAKAAPTAVTGVTALEPGEVLDDFQVVKVLGKGAFGVVYLARQVSLDRQVALKVAANEGSEGRTMARLEHDHIVQVFSESVDETGRLRLLCMQLVPGASLEGVILNLHRREEARGEWTGSDYLAIVESRAQVSAVLDSSALRDRQLLADYDATQTAAWVGARLAEAVDYAHKQGVLHRDIKPANILVNQYGRPMLADFNISFRGFDEEASVDSSFGGTLAFMAPEHLDAFDPTSQASPADVDERSDLYSLAIVIHELLTGRRPFIDPPRDDSRTQHVRSLAAARRAAPPPLDDSPPTPRKTLLRTLSKSLNGEKADRYQHGAELAAALDGCRRLQTAVGELPPARWLTLAATRAPFVWLVVLAVGPQIIGSMVNISYNLVEIVGVREISGKLTESQQALFWDRLVPIYNVLVYPLLIAIGVSVIKPVYRVWKQLHGDRRVDEDRVRHARRRAMSLPYWMLGIAAAGWLPGGVIFPACLDLLLDEPVGPSVYGHFFISFALSGLIAVAYSFCGLQFLALRVFYPRLWSDATDFQHLAHEELADTPQRMRLINLLSGAIPSIGIAFVVAPGLIHMAATGQTEYSFALVNLILIGGFLLIGLVGNQITTLAASRMTKAYSALVGRGV